MAMSRFIINDIHSVIIITTFMHAIDIVRYYIYDQELHAGPLLLISS
ncbi:hypothetical protein BQ8769_92 [Escherichia coli]|uniref:Uncharacterized protein n=1 Tax=Escherichia coli TaxID=562 RepID=A0A1W1EMF9_ECOLX|nr:hypothetical protein BQ8769_92 [Escherichia coli]